MFAPGVSRAGIYAGNIYESRVLVVPCSSLAIVSPQNCLAILSPCWVGSSPQKRRRRSDERVGAKGEPERDPSDACGRPDNRRAGNCGKRSKAFGDFCTSDEAATAQDEGAGC